MEKSKDQEIEELRRDLQICLEYIQCVAYEDQIDYKEEAHRILADLDPIYCPECNSCGEANGCCPPSICNYVNNMITYEAVCDVIDETVKKYENDYDDDDNGILIPLIKSSINKLFTPDGLYCKSNWEEWRAQEVQVNDFYLALVSIATDSEDSKLDAINVLNKYYGDCWRNNDLS